MQQQQQEQEELVELVGPRSRKRARMVPRRE
jgi:hypothetical protein